MLAEERHREILELVNGQKTVTVQELTELLHTSESTIRRDLTTLHREGSLIKVHGGATALQMDQVTKDAALSVRNDMNKDEKMAIGKYAASLVQKGDVIYLDAGSSVDRVIQFLTEQDVLYVTNSIGHAQKLLKKGFRTYLLGGELKSVTEAIVGAQAVESLERYNFTKGFFGTNGVHLERGFTTPDITEALVKEKAAARCLTRYMLADSTKLGQVSAVTFAKFEDGIVLTTKDVDPFYRNQKNIQEVV